MTRNDEIIEAAKCSPFPRLNDDFLNSVECGESLEIALKLAFTEGAKWADNNPVKKETDDTSNFTVNLINYDNEREIEVHHKAKLFSDNKYDLPLENAHDKEFMNKIAVANAFAAGAHWADMNPTTEFILKVFQEFDKHHLFKEDLSFDPRHFIDTVIKPKITTVINTDDYGLHV